MLTQSASHDRTGRCVVPMHPALPLFCRASWCVCRAPPLPLRACCVLTPLSCGVGARPDERSRARRGDCQDRGVLTKTVNGGADTMAAAAAARSIAAADAATLAREVPYDVDDEMKAWLRAFRACHTDVRRARQAELGRRLVTRAEANWPPHSLALAVLRTLAVRALGDARRAHFVSSGISLPSEMERSLLQCVDDAVLARLGAGTLLRCTPSEKRAYSIITVALDPMNGRRPPPPHMSGYDAANMTGAEHLKAIGDLLSLGDSIPNVGSMIERHARFVLRVFDLVCSTRQRSLKSFTKGRSALDGASELVLLDACCGSEGHLIDAIGIICAAFTTLDPRVAGVFLARHIPSDTWAQLQAGWNRVTASLGADVVEAARRAGMDKRNELLCVEAQQHASWTARRCAQCDAPEAEPRQWKLCSACGDMAYCCKEHQAAHWRAGHRKACRKGSSGAAAGDTGGASRLAATRRDRRRSACRCPCLFTAARSVRAVKRRHAQRFTFSNNDDVVTSMTSRE